MSFESLTERISLVFKRLGSKGKLIEEDIKIAMREIKLSLLEADVNYVVVKNFISRVSERALGEEIMKSLTPAQMVVKIVKEELVSVLGGGESSINVKKGRMNVVMLCGLQGAGKTTHCAKIALYFKNKGFNPLISACDIYRPAAIDQIKTLGKKIDIRVYSERSNNNAVEISKNSFEFARHNEYDLLILDTAGRLHIDENLMDELVSIEKEIKINEILLTIDAMTGQDAVKVAQKFSEKLNITGLILTKFDGDTRGGAALSVKEVTGCPVKFMGVGEKLGDLEPFKPDRIASRILGMGDIESLIEKAQQNINHEDAEKMAKKFSENKFDLEDFLSVFNQVKKMGSFRSIISRLPGMGNLNNLDFDDKLIGRVEAIILSMTLKERRNPKIIDSSRKKRIARGSGTKVEDVNNLLKRFVEMQKVMKQFNNRGGFFGRFNPFSKFIKR